LGPKFSQVLLLRSVHIFTKEGQLTAVEVAGKDTMVFTEMTYISALSRVAIKAM
jgi:hypothetical protein